jgi:NAD(P)H-hydrate epimerase
MMPPGTAVAISVERMQEIDATAIQTLGIPRLLLMEHAGLAVAKAVRALCPPPHQRGWCGGPREGGTVVVCCGTGYNGGDGLAAARHLHDWGYAMRILLTGSVDRLREEPAVYAAILQRLAVPIRECPAGQGLPDDVKWIVAGADVIVDALLGIGIRGAVREPVRSLIACVNRAGRPVVSADVPSGLDADTGDIQGAAVKASVTVAFGLPKRGCYVKEGPAHAGSLIVDSISIPRHLLRIP